MNKQQPKLNLKLLRKVRDRIAEIPESYDQDHFYRSADSAPCGSAACLAGETIIVAAPTVKEGIARLRRIFAQDVSWWDIADAPIARRAAKSLGISKEDANRFFSSGRYSEWPQPFKSRFARAKTPKARARVAVAYLDECLRRKAVTW